MKKNVKIAFIIITILIIYAIIILVFFRKDNKKSTYLILDNSYNLEYKNNTYKIVTNDEIIKSKNNFKAYDGGKYIGKYHLKHAKNWNLFSENEEFKMYNEYLFAVSDNSDFKVKDLINRKLNDKDKLIIKNTFKVNNFEYLINSQVFDVDLDDNGEVDQIVCLTNSYYNSDSTEVIDNYNLENEYNLIFIILNGKPITLIKKIATRNIDFLEIGGVFKIGKEKSFNIVLRQIENPLGDSVNNIDSIYKYNSIKNNFVKIVSN